MKKKQQAPTTYTTDAHGQRLAHVALANTDQRATLYAEDLEQLLAAGFSAHWGWCKTGPRFRYVLVHARTPDGKTRRTMTVARLIAGAGKGRVVEYIDGDRANLRRENLRIVRGSGRAQTPAAAVLPCHPSKLPGGFEAPPGADAVTPCVACADRPQTTPAGATRRTLEAPQRPQVTPLVTPVPRVVDRVALSARVRQQLAQRATQQHQRQL